MAAFTVIGVLVLSVQILNVRVHAVEHSSPKGQVLVFGGNAFMGAATVKVLLNDQYAVTIVNRGNWYWDAADTIRPYVHQITCDRYAENITAQCPALVDFVAEIGRFEAVVDFSAMKGQAMENSLSLLRGRVDYYVYISSDSVYEISERDYDGPSREDGFRVPEDPIYRALLEKADDYAWGKIQGELLLRKHAEADGLKYIALRLPDVIGPRDTFFDRFLQYHLWIRLSQDMKKPVFLPSQFINAPMSLVYVEDVAEIIGKILTMDKAKLATEYNLAFRERLTLLSILQSMQRVMGIGQVEYDLDEKNQYYLLLPSVKRGPIDISRAITDLGWNPSDPQVAIHETVFFFDNAMHRGAFEESYRRRREGVVRQLKETIFKGQESELDLAIDATYGPIRVEKDEL